MDGVSSSENWDDEDSKATHTNEDQGHSDGIGHQRRIKSNGFSDRKIGDWSRSLCSQLTFWKVLGLLFNILHRAGIKLHARRKLTGSGRGVAALPYFNLCAHFAAVPYYFFAKIYTFHSSSLTSTELT